MSLLRSILSACVSPRRARSGHRPEGELTPVTARHYRRRPQPRWMAAVAPGRRLVRSVTLGRRSGLSATAGIVAAIAILALFALPGVWSAVNPSPAGASAGTVTVDHVFTATGLGSATARVRNAGGHDLAVAFVTGDQASGEQPGQTATVTGGGAEWTPASQANTQMGIAGVWSQHGAGATAFDVTATLPEMKNVVITVVTFRGWTAIGATATGGGMGGAPAVSLAPTVTGSRVYAAGFDWDRGVPRTLPVGQTVDSQTIDDAGDTHWVQHTAASAPGKRVTVKDEGPTSDRWNMAAVEVVAVLGTPRGTSTSLRAKALSTTTPTPISAPPTSAPPVTPVPTSTPATTAPPRTTTTPPTTANVPFVGGPGIQIGGGGRPDASNTGVPPGHSLLVLNGGVRAMTLGSANTSPAGCAGWDGSSLVTNRDGCTIHDVDADGDFLFTNNDTTLRFDKIHDANKNFPGSDNNIVVQASWGQNVSGAVIEDSEVYADSGVSYGIAGSNFTLLRDNIHNASHDLQITGAGNVNVISCYLHGIVAQSGDHTELAYLDSSPNVVFKGNTWVFNRSAGSEVADIFSDGASGPGGPMVLDGNWFGGDGAQWTVHVDDKGSSLTFVNNHVTPSYGLAMASFFGGTPSTRGNNTWDGSGQTPDFGSVSNGQPIPGF